MILYSMQDIKGYIGWNPSRQWELAESAGVEIVKGPKFEGGRNYYGYRTLQDVEKLLKAGGYVLVKHEGSEKMVLKKYIKEFDK